MFLTRVLLRYRFYNKKHIPGRQWIGKHRRHRPITWQMLRNLRERLAIEEENAKYLSTPYLTKEESIPHEKLLRKAAVPGILRGYYMEKIRPHRTTEEHLAHLKTTSKW